MTKKITALMLSVIAASAIIIGCKKEKEEIIPKQDAIMSRAQDRQLGTADKGGEPDAYYVQMIFDQSVNCVVDYGTFAHMIDRIGNNTTDIFTDIYNAGGITLVNAYKERVRTIQNYKEMQEFYLTYRSRMTLQEPAIAPITASCKQSPTSSIVNLARYGEVVKRVRTCSYATTIGCVGLFSLNVISLSCTKTALIMSIWRLLSNS